MPSAANLRPLSYYTKRSSVLHNIRMHTDEYGITLSREVNISRKKVAEHLQAIGRFEAQFGMSSAQFLEKLAAGELPDATPEHAAWRDQCAALDRWRQKLAEYEALYKAWK